ncbi:hypothetical protein G9A89_010841 [Geosiphon pyriformis]|nr:hypothetical protein G9A89_010841 [Geosiphon pyriformis]
MSQLHQKLHRPRSGSTHSLAGSVNGATVTLTSTGTQNFSNGNARSNINASNQSNSNGPLGGNSHMSPLNDTHGEQRKLNRESMAHELPTGPPSKPFRDPTSDSFSTHAYSWPILFAVIPPMGGLIYGKSEVWSDFLLLLLIAFYLYNIIKVPWELYYAARSRRVMNENVLTGQTADLALEANRLMAARELRRLELYALGLVLASPIFGGFALHYVKRYFEYDEYISHFNISLFVFAAGIRPLMHIASLAKNRTLHLQEQVHYPSTEVELLKSRVQHLEYEFSQLRRGLATKRDVIQVRDGIEPTISQLNKVVKKYEKKEQYLRTYSEERFTYLEAKLREYDSFIAYKLQEEQAMSLPRSMMQVIFLPLNVTFTVLGYAKYFLPLSLRGRQTPMLAGSHAEDENIGNRLHGDTQEVFTSGRDLQKY